MTRLLAIALALSASLTVGTATPVCAAGGCCKVCSKGKACGDTCIARNRVCHTVGGCACDG